MRLPQDAESLPCFTTLKEITSFYDSLSFGIMGFLVGARKGIINFDCHVLDSIHATLLSIHDILIQGRIGDAYMLLRKYNDAIVINTYETILFLAAEDRGEIIVGQIDDWIEGRKPLPPFKEMNRYIQKYAGLQGINGILASERRFARIRKRCNDFCHANYFAYMQINSDIIYPDYGKLMEQFRGDVSSLAAMHFALLFSLRPHYMISSDYMDALEVGMPPEPDSQYLVAPYVQSFFDSFVKLLYPKLAQEMLKTTTMKLS